MNRFFLKTITLLLVVISLYSCTKKNNSNTVFFGTIKGLRKGTVYLKKVIDTSLVVIDSVQLRGADSFEFNLNLSEPDLYYFYLDKKDGIVFNDLAEVFLEPNKKISASTQLDQFNTKLVVKGSENHTRFEAFKKINNKFNLKRFKLIDALTKQLYQKNKDSVVYLKKQLQKVMKNKYLYTVNFGLSNADYEVAPYVLVKEVKDAQIKYLDTVFKSLTPKVKSSKYGMQLKQLLLKRQ